jgi:hypothetical protein
VALLEALMRKPKLPPAVKEVALTAAMKLTARLPSQVRAVFKLRWPQALCTRPV